MPQSSRKRRLQRLGRNRGQQRQAIGLISLALVAAAATAIALTSTGGAGPEQVVTPPVPTEIGSLVPGASTSTTPLRSAFEAPTLAAVGDIACSTIEAAENGGFGNNDRCASPRVADLLFQLNPTAFLPLGDIQYPKGSLEDFKEVYEKQFGGYRGTVLPIPGNHEYQTEAGTGYYTYFGRRARDPRKGYYSTNLGRWHLVALNSSCAATKAQRAAGDPRCNFAEQAEWLARDLRTNKQPCTLAFFHHARWSSGYEDINPEVYNVFWKPLYDARADIVLSGHSHNYERFRPQDTAGHEDVRGPIQFVVGTGGASHTPMRAIRPNSVVHDNTTYGLLELELGDGKFRWQFHPVNSEGFRDSGSGTCHQAQRR